MDSTWYIGAVFFLKRGKMMRKMTPTERSSEASYEFVRNAPKNNILCVILRIIFPRLRKKNCTNVLPIDTLLYFKIISM